MSEYWTPSGPAILATATVAGQQVVVASNQAEGLARFHNANSTTGFVALVSASATAGDAANAAAIAGNASLFIAFTKATPYAYVSGASSVYAQAGYALK
jgi:hypothetical protein